LKGLNSLRFFAAFFVILSHANISLDKLGIYRHSGLAFLNRGGDAVDFFFTLSGFLITYLLILEINKTGTVSIKRFYLRRIFRIWPLYFLIVLLGFLILGWLYPKIYGSNYFSFSIVDGLLMFVLFIPNYAASNYPVGLLNPLWSIGVEEQFYLFWAPLVKFFRRWLLYMIVIFLLFSSLFYVLVDSGLVAVSPQWKKFLLTQKFYAMAIGSVFAYVLYHYYDVYNKSIFSTRYGQLLILLIVAGHYLIGFSFSDSLLFKILLALLYGLLIMNVSVVKIKIINIEHPVLAYLGVISYGIYMYHMLVDYFLRMMIPAIRTYLPVEILIGAYYLMLILITVLIAALSYRYFEKFFLNMKNRFHNEST